MLILSGRIPFFFPHGVEINGDLGFKRGKLVFVARTPIGGCRHGGSKFCLNRNDISFWRAVFYTENEKRIMVAAGWMDEDHELGQQFTPRYDR